MPVTNKYNNGATKVGISLEKGQKISLAKGNGSKLARIEFGCGWGRKTIEKKGFFGGSKKSTKSVDLDASCILLDANNSTVDTVWYRELTSECRSVVHSGDDRAGGGSEAAPNEVIKVNLDAVPSNVDALVFVINSFSNDVFEGIPHAFGVIHDSGAKNEFARYTLQDLGPQHTALVLGKIYRHNGDWKFQAIGESTHGRTVEDIGDFVRSIF